MFRTYFEVVKYAFLIGGGLAAGAGVVKGAQAAATKGIALLQIARSGKGETTSVSLDDQTDSV